jgi:ribosomal-protein-alanine N-acetyltransferase
MLDLNFSPFPFLETKRLILREIAFEDSAEIFALRSNPDAMKFIGKPPATSIEDANKMIRMFTDGISNNESITWGIAFKETNRIVGTIGFWRISKDHHRAEIGYMLHPEHWKKGILTEAAKAVIECGFRKFKFHSIEAQLTPENIASVKLLEKTGFVKEAHFKENYFFEGEYSDTAVYSKLNPFG